MAKEKAQLKVKKKIWFPIVATSHFNNVEVGETFIAQPSALIGRNVSYNLGLLMNDSKSQNVKVTFKIKEIKDNRALTELVKYEIASGSLKRMVHKGKEKIDDSFKLKSRDGVNVRVKPFIVTKSAANRSILTALRKKSQELLADFLKRSDYEAFFQDIIRFKVQSIMKKELKKIYPLAQFQIRILEKLASQNTHS